jgi:hypothetical protein
LVAGETFAVTLSADVAGAMLTVVVVVAVFPALSVTVPVNDWCEPIVVTVIGAEQVEIPDAGSVQMNVMVALPKLNPFRFGDGETLPRMVGRVSSTLSVAAAVAVFPAASVTVPEIT